jgi:hypothetical protein
MPEIRLGSSKNMKNINLGSKEIEEVRLGRTLVWVNNLSPQIVLTSPPIGEYGDQNFDIGVTIATNVNIVFSAQDPDILDTIVSYAVDGPSGFTPVPTTPITPGNPVSGLTFTIPNTLFVNPGEPTTNNVFTITVTDQRGKEGVYTVTVTGVSIEPPVVSVTQEFHSGFSLKYLNPTSVTRTARFAIAQSPAAIAAGYTAQYSLDGGVNWVNGTSVSITKSTTCGKAVSATVYCRSVKTGEATANGNSASSTLRVTAPQAYFPLTGGGGCVMKDYFTTTSGGNAIRGFYQSQSCDGRVYSAGSTYTDNVTLTSDNVFIASQANVIFTGTAPQTMVADGRSAPLDRAFQSDMRYDVTYTVPSTAGTGIPFSCSGGDIRRTAYYLGNNITTVNSISGDLGTTGVGSLLNRGPDYIYTSLSINSPHVSINVNGNGFGDTTYAASFNQVGTTATRPIYTGYYRLASGGTKSLSGTNQNTKYFQTLEP